MTQAVRSGQQNTVEAPLEKSVAGNIQLTGIARASYGELLEDDKDFLRLRGLTLWEKDDPRWQELRALRNQ
jgi:hypothetical protein